MPPLDIPTPIAARPRRPDAVAWLVLAILLAAGTIYAVALGDRLRYPDEREYLQLARNLVADHAFTYDGATPTAYRAPGYPLLLAAPLAFGLPVAALRLLNVAALVLSAYLLHCLLARFASPLAAALGPALVLAYPVLFYTAGTLYPQILAGLLLLLALDLALRPTAGGGALLLSGLAFGALILGVPTFALKLPLFLGAILLVRRERPWRTVALIAVAALAVMGAWTARNYVAFGRFVPLTTNAGYNLILSNSAHATANGGALVDISQYDAAVAGLGEVERDAVYRREVVAWVEQHPAAAARLYARKLLNYFNYRNDLYVSSEGGTWRDLLMLATYGPLLALLAVRLALIRRWPPSRFEWCCIALYLANAPLDALGMTRIRYRLPFDLLLIAVVAVFLETLCRRRWRRDRHGA